MQRFVCRVLIVHSLIAALGCGGPDKKQSPPSDGDGGGSQGNTAADGDGGEPGPDAGDPTDPNSPLGRCLEACETFAPQLAEACFGASSSRADRAAQKFGLTAASDAVALQIASSEPDLKAVMQRVAGKGVLYSPAAGVVLLTRPPAAAMLRMQELWPNARRLPVLITAQGRRVVVPGRVIVRLRAGRPIHTVLPAVEARLLRTVDVRANTYLLEVDEPMDAFEVAERLSSLDAVMYAEPSLLRPYQRRAPIADPLTPNQWHLLPAPQSGAAPASNIMANLAWRISEGSKDVVVGIFDDGVDFGHPDLKGAIVPGLNVPTDLQTAVQDGCCWHGTGVAGVAAAQANNIGLRGVCPSCSVMPMFFGTSDDSMLSEDVATAELFTEGCKKAAVINNSWGLPDGSPEVDDPQQKESLAAIVDDALKFCETSGRGGLGTVIVFAAGNGNESIETDPFASHPLTVAVAAVDDTGRKSYYSDFGASLDVSAPSDGGRTSGIWTTALRGQGNQQQDQYMDDFGGTSSAAPVVTGLVGLILSVNPNLTAKQVRDLLANTADKVDQLGGRYDAKGFSVVYGHGRVNAYRALREAERLLGKCTDLGEELCNGIDDDCNGKTDEGCTKVATCGACELDAACASGTCVLTLGDTEPRCLEACTQGSCSAGYTCQQGLCVPPKGRCAAPTSEVCNGVDDDLNGKIDESNCQDQQGFCRGDSDCEQGTACAGGSCLAICRGDSDCPDTNAECSIRTDRYGRSDGTKVCLTPFDPCVNAICALEDDERLKFVECVDQGPTSCDELFACVPEGLF